MAEGSNDRPNGAGRITLSTLKNEIDILREELRLMGTRFSDHLDTAEGQWSKLERHISDEEETKKYLRMKLEQNDQFHRDLQPLVDGIQGLSMFGQMVSKLAKIGKPLAYLVIFFMSIVVVVGQWGQKAWLAIKMLVHP